MIGVMKEKQSGNVLFVILITIALFAALSFAVSQGGRGNVSVISQERARLLATDIIEYGNILANATAQLRLRGYDETQISFNNQVVTGYSNSNCGDTLCEVFHPEGGAVNWTSPPAGANDGTEWVITHNRVQSVGTQVGSGTADLDLVAVLQNVDEAVCEQLNQLLHGTTVIPQENDSVNLAQFTGTYSTTIWIADTGGGSGPIAGESAYCFEGNTTPAAGTFHYYRVLIAR